MKINVSTPSTGYAVATTDMVNSGGGWLRYTSTNENGLIAGLIAAENDHAEKTTNRALLTQTIDLYRDYWTRRIDLPRPPLQSVTSVGYRPAGSTAYTVAPSTLYLVSTHGMTPYLELKDGANWPTAALEDVNPIRIRYVAGATSTTGVPAAIKTAIKLNVASRFQHRESETEASLKRTGAASRLLALYRVGTFT